MGHVLGFDGGVELFGGDVAEFDGGVAEVDAGVVRGFGDFGCVVVADFGSERGDQHERILHIAVNLRAIDFDTDDAVIHKRIAGIGEEFDAVQIVEDHHRLEYV